MTDYTKQLEDRISELENRLTAAENITAKQEEELYPLRPRWEQEPALHHYFYGTNFYRIASVFKEYGKWAISFKFCKIAPSPIECRNYSTLEEAKAKVEEIVNMTKQLRD